VDGNPPQFKGVLMKFKAAELGRLLALPAIRQKLIINGT
jgi:hypothetical protein